MRNLLTFVACLIPMLLQAQGPILRNPVTTNAFMNLPSDGWIAVWNNAASKWSNTINTSTQTNVPAYLQTATLTNLAGTGLSTGATNASAYIGSSAGKGTNIDFWLVTEFYGDVLGASNYYATNGAFIQTGGGVGFKSKGAFQFTSAGGSIQDAGGIARVDVSNGGGVSLNGTDGTTGLDLDSAGNVVLEKGLGLPSLTASSILTINSAGKATNGVVSSPLELAAGNLSAGLTLSNFQQFATNITYVPINSETTNGINNAASGSFVEVGQGNVSIPTRIVTTSPQNTTLRTIGKQNITYHGNGTVLWETNKGRFWSIVNSSNITIEGFVFQGFVSNRCADITEIEGMLALVGTNKNILIQNCIFQNGYGAGVTVDPNELSSGNVNSDYVTVQNCFFFTNGTARTTNEGAGVPRHSAIMGPGNFWTIQNNKYLWNVRDFEFATPSPTAVRSFKYLNNHSDYALAVGFFMNAQNTNCIGVDIIGNTWMHMMGGPGSTYFTNLAGAITNTAPAPITIGGASSVNIKNNFFSENGFIPNIPGASITILPSANQYDYVISGNVSRNNTAQAYNLSGPLHNVIVSDNIAYNENRAFYLAFSDGVVSGNVALGTNTGGSGMTIGAGSTNISVFGNRISWGAGTALSIDASARDIIYYGNDFTGNAGEVSDSSQGTTNYVTLKNLRVLNLATNALLNVNASGIVKTTALSGLTFDGVTLTSTASGGSGGTNFPNINLQAGNTNYVLSTGVRKAFYMSTNGSHGINLNLAVPNSGYDVIVIHTNSSGTDYTVTFYTNSVAASFYSIIDKTNATSWVVQGGSIVSQHFLFTGTTWLRTDVEGPLLTLAAGASTTLTTNGTVLTVAAPAVGGSAAIQFAEGTSLAGTNGTDTKFIYDRTNSVLRIVGLTPKFRIEDSTFLGTNEFGPTYQNSQNSAYVIYTPFSSLVIGGAIQTTNRLGLKEKSAASVVELDFNDTHKFTITNRISAATTLVMTNGFTGQEMNVFMIGEASGGTARVVTIQPQLGHLVANEDAFGSALASNFSFTLTNGNAVEISSSIRRLNGTNVMGVVTRQFQF